MSEKTKQEYISDGLDVFAEGKYHEAIDIYRKALDIALDLAVRLQSRDRAGDKRSRVLPARVQTATIGPTGPL